MLGTHFSYDTLIFHGRQLPEEGFVVGYAAIIHGLAFKIPMPGRIAIVSKQHKRYQTEEWNVFPKRYLPNDHTNLPKIESIHTHLTFALKYEGINLLFFSALASYFSSDEISELLNIDPTGQYSRKIWFLIEWVSGKRLSSKQDLSKRNYIPLLDEKLQYGIEGLKSPRHRIINNLPGTKVFCPLISRTPKLEKYISAGLEKQQDNFLSGIRKDIMLRASAFLLLKDSKASFSIEGENLKNKRAARWGQAIGQAGSRSLNKEELLRLQQIVIENTRFLEMGFRKKGGFVGEHDRNTGEPLPDHISAKWQDIEQLMDGLLETNKLLINSNMDAVLVAAVIAFGFVFIHPFEDGNGRIHRYLIHDVLAKKKFSQQGIIFPVSASILSHIDDYRRVLESYSHPVLEYIEWNETPDHNVEVLNNTIDFYRYFDATKQAEFLYDCVNDTIQNIIPAEVSYLIQYDEMKEFLSHDFDMPDRTVALLIRFLEQNNGNLSKRAREKEFSTLTDEEVQKIEEQYRMVFM